MEELHSKYMGDSKIPKIPKISGKKYYHDNSMLFPNRIPANFKGEETEKKNLGLTGIRLFCR